MIEVNQVWALRADPKSVGWVVDAGDKPKVRFDTLTIRFKTVEDMERMMGCIGVLPEIGQTWRDGFADKTVRIMDVQGSTVFTDPDGPMGLGVFLKSYMQFIRAPKIGSKWFRPSAKAIKYEVIKVHDGVVTLQTQWEGKLAVVLTSFYEMFEGAPDAEVYDKYRANFEAMIESVQKPVPHVGQWWRDHLGCAWRVEQYLKTSIEFARGDSLWAAINPPSDLGELGLTLVTDPAEQAALNMLYTDDTPKADNLEELVELLAAVRAELAR